MDWFYRAISVLLKLFTVNYFLKLTKKSTTVKEDVIYLPYNLRMMGAGFILSGSILVLLLTTFMSNLRVIRCL